MKEPPSSPLVGGQVNRQVKMMASRERPVHEIQLTRIRATIWAHRGTGRRIWYSVTIVRRYRAGEEWKDATSFNRDDLPLVAKVAELAYAWIWQSTTDKDDSCER